MASYIVTLYFSGRFTPKVAKKSLRNNKTATKKQQVLKIEKDKTKTKTKTNANVFLVKYSYMCDFEKQK